MLSTSAVRVASGRIIGATAFLAATGLVRQFFALLVIAFALSRAIATYALSIAAGGEGWSAGEWLISYSGGFVRRGLFGQLLLTFAPGGQPGLWVLFSIQVGLSLVVAAYGIHALHRSRYAWSTIALVAGPAAIPFIGWGQLEGAFRKELLVFVVLALLAWMRQVRHRLGVLLLSIAALSVFVLAVFSWEPSVLLLPAVAYLLLHEPDEPLLLLNFRRSIAVLFVLIGATGFLLSVRAPGGYAAATAMCQSIRAHGYLGPALCGGAINHGIGWTTADSLAELAGSFPLFVGYVPLAVLALIPATLSRWFTTHRAWGAALALGVLPLFFIATDYGRWTYALAMAFMFVITADDPTDASSPFWNAGSGSLYVLLWGIPHFLAADGEWPWLGPVATLVRNLIEEVSRWLGYPIAPGVAGSRPR